MVFLTDNDNCNKECLNVTYNDGDYLITHHKVLTTFMFCPREGGSSPLTPPPLGFPARVPALKPTITPFA
jgi:hypothetical protein